MSLDYACLGCRYAVRLDPCGVLMNDPFHAVPECGRSPDPGSCPCLAPPDVHPIAGPVLREVSTDKGSP